MDVVQTLQDGHVIDDLIQETLLDVRKYNLILRTLKSSE